MGVKIIFTDVGGVLLTNGWDRETRLKAVENFELDWDDVEERHQQVVEDYETGHLTITGYLDHVIFFKQRSFSSEQFKAFMFDASKPYTDMIELIKKTKADTGCRVAVLSNEAREMALYRFDKFQFHTFIDFYVVSCFVHVCKPDARIYHLASDLAQVKPEEALYIDDRPKLIETASNLGFRTIFHREYASTREALLRENFG